jgi:hypothetical protein
MPMSTAPAPAPPTSTRSPDEIEIRIISHSNLFYWWPVWAIGLILGLLSWIFGETMVIVPANSEVYPTATVEVQKSGTEMAKLANRDVVVLPDNKHLLADQLKDAKDGGKRPKLHVSPSKNYGVIFATVLLLVIVITNVPLRGMWSVVVILLVIMMVIIFSLAGWWEAILGTLALLSIHINAGGYVFISLILLGVWLVTFIFFDQQVYMIFTPGQVKVRTEIGGGEVVYDTVGMTVQKQRSDLFRHWILGLGSGDLLVTTTGAAAHHFDLPNVLFIGKKVQMIEDMLREKAVVRGR